MSSQSIRRALSIALTTALVTVAGCDVIGEPETLNPPDPPTAGPMFASYVAIGNSITAGDQSGGINDSTQAQSPAESQAAVRDRIPDQIETVLGQECRAREIAARFYQRENWLFLGRGVNHTVALEGALKLKEISYIHAEGYPAAEMKHGPIALIDEDTPSVFIIANGPLHQKVMANLAEVKARGGPVIAIACEGDTEIGRAHV